MINELVTVIIPIYKENKETILKSIGSIQNQTYKNLEILVINDNPKGDNQVIISSLMENDKRIILINNESNLGITLSLNKGIENAKGSYICRMDADDYSHPDRVEKQMIFLLNNDMDLVGCNSNFVISGISVGKSNYPTDCTRIREAFKYKNCITHPTWIFKKEIILKIGAYKDFIACEDYEFLIRCLLNGLKINNVDDYLFDYSLSEQGISLSKSAVQELTARWLRKKYKKNCIPDFEEYKKYISSNKASKEIKALEKYFSIKNRRTLAKSNKLQFIIYTICLLIHPKQFFIDFWNKLNFKRCSI